jgi:hypothetical protein
MPQLRGNEPILGLNKHLGLPASIGRRLQPPSQDPNFPRTTQPPLL